MALIGDHRDDGQDAGAHARRGARDIGDGVTEKCRRLSDIRFLTHDIF